ncbi:alpha-L-fucosidase [Paenibacillus sp. UMB7766-LJ446]|uniref:alpha-L-fucosidase n=1 Tax=Paenibacillus sp. UMB7766-LJ446 TaxID=3046313 RepID=UPI00255134F0|nr:alpha-L-fucosidase [Paenibacillus sp. UMB7766-LJ446]MDK8189910.1 alpha-L-fucosidase [Paenibacillus sp. UMB7766-LJ446]
MKATHPEAQWFDEARFGIFIHWGPYSVREIEASWPLMSDHSQHIDAETYESMADEFNPALYDPVEWARNAKEAGAKYVVLTAKHHDGFCLFDTKTTDYNAVQRGPKRDLIAPFVEAVRNEGLKVGLYFTTIDWHDPDFATIPIDKNIQSPKPNVYDPARWWEFHKRFVEQLRELLTHYGRIDLLWFDVPGFGADRWRSHEVKRMMLNLQPHLIMNDRLPDAGDYATPEQFVPLHPPEEWWETCMTMNHQWAYHADPATYKSPITLLNTLLEVTAKGGNLLLNVGPRPDGTWPEEAVERLRKIGSWLKHSGESIYGTKRIPEHYPPCFYGPMTVKANSVYLHVRDLPRFPLELRELGGKVKDVRLLRTGQSLAYRTEVTVGSTGGIMGDHHVKRLWIDLKQEDCDEWNSVVAVDFETEPVWPVFLRN